MNHFGHDQINPDDVSASHGNRQGYESASDIYSIYYDLLRAYR